MITMYAWDHLTESQRAQAEKECGLPPSGAQSVIWAKTPQGWRWRSGLFVDDVRKGFAVGKAAGKRKAAR